MCCAVLRVHWENVAVFTNNSGHESKELLLLLLPAHKVSVDQSLQLNQVFVLSLLMDVLLEP